MKNSLTLCLLLLSTVVAAQDYTMTIRMKDGNIQQINISDIDSIEITPTPEDVPKLLRGLTGRWQLIASNEGVEIAPGVFSATTDTIYFNATPSAEGRSLNCHTDKMHARTSTVYPADWTVVVEEQQGKRRIGWVLDDQKPAYSDGTSHLYLLSENINATAWLGMTFWSPWSEESATVYSLSNEENNARKVYGLLSTQIPFSSPTGMIEIWSSPRFEKLP